MIFECVWCVRSSGFLIVWVFGSSGFVMVAYLFLMVVVYLGFHHLMNLRVRFLVWLILSGDRFV